MNPLSPHLTEDEFDEILMEIASPAADAHAAGCELCALQLAALRTQFQTQFQPRMAAFNQASLDWSAARSNTISRDIPAHKLTPRLTLTTIWSSAATLVVALTFGITAAMHNSATLEADRAATTHPDHDQSELASDNAMLQAIDSEMGTPRPANFGLYQESGQPHAHRVAASLQVKD